MNQFVSPRDRRPERKNSKPVTGIKALKSGRGDVRNLQFGFWVFWAILRNSASRLGRVKRKQISQNSNVYLIMWLLKELGVLFGHAGL